MANVFIKNVNDEAYRAAKVMAALEDKPVGQVVSESIMLFVGEKKKAGLDKVKPVNLGKGTEKLSTTIDEILYG